MNRKFFVVLMSSLFIFACGKKLPTVDSSTPETYKASLDRVSQSVPKEKEENFNFPISILAMESIKEHIVDGVIMTDDEQDEQGKKKFQKSLHGLNYKQIMSRSDQDMKSKMERAKEQYEEELNYKLLSREEINAGYYFKFNVAVILRADLKTQIETLSKAVSSFIYTPNEARALLDKPAKTGGDKLLGNGAYIPVDLAGTQYTNLEY